MPETHQLAAIMFTDIVGYTALMGESEAKAYHLLKKNRQVQKPLIEKNDGKWLKEIGDGVLASFQTVSDAVYCAIDIQEACLNEPNLKLRIGIHLGEVIAEDGDVFGDGVNIASRLESLAPTGGIWVSESVKSNVQNKQHIETRFIGEKQLKNVKEPVRVYEVMVKGAQYIEPVVTSRAPSARQDSSTKKRIVFISLVVVAVLSLIYFLYPFQAKEEAVAQSQTIAVLSFDDQSPDGDQEWLGDGMADEILNVLAKVNGLQVTGKTSSFSFKGKDVTISEIGRILSVKTVLEGSVSKVGNKLRITAQLIDVESDKHIWSNKYDRDWGDVFTIIDEVSQSITSSLISELSIEELGEIKKNRTDNIKAFELYQLGRFYWNKRTGEGYQRSIEYFRQAIDEDPEYGLAYAGLADTYNLMALQGHIDQTEGRDKAVDLSKKALELDDQLAEAHNVLASIYTYIDRDWESAEREYLKAIEINPNYPTVHHYYSEYLSFIGKHEEAREQVNKAIELDPLSFVIRYVSVKYNFNQGQFQEALLDLERCRELNHGKDHNWIAHMDFRINRELGNEQAAFDGIKRWYGNFLSIMEPKEMDSIYQISGIDGILKRRIESTDYLWEKPSLYGILGNDEKALEWLEIAVEKGEEPAEFPFLYEFRNLHSNPRFQALLRKIGLGDI